MEQTKERIAFKPEILHPKVCTARYDILDFIRGITITSMIIYHFVWDLVYLAGFNFQWYYGRFAHIWQQSICCMFIILAGFCCRLSKKKLKRACTVFLSGALVTLITFIFMPEDRVIFGVLTFLGSSMLLMIPLERVLSKADSRMGVVISFTLFLLTYNIGSGYIGLFKLHLFDIPDSMYRLGYVGTFFGFTDKNFFSADYFPIFPWFFLFLCGYFIFEVFKRYRFFEKSIFKLKLKNPFTVIGRHSLIIYMLHQPILFFTVKLLFMS